MCGQGFSRWKCMWKASWEVRPTWAKARGPDPVSEGPGTCRAFREKNYQVCNTHFYIRPSQLPSDAKEADSCTWRMKRSVGTVCRRDVLGWSDTEPTFEGLIWEVRACGSEWAGARGREPGAVVFPVRHSGKLTPLFGIKLMSIKTKL